MSHYYWIIGMVIAAALENVLSGLRKRHPRYWWLSALAFAVTFNIGMFCGGRWR
jgi:hypothetical protein